MGVEIERKFLVDGDAWRDEVRESHAIAQGYLSRGAGNSVRVRSYDDQRAKLTIKGKEFGFSRLEFEYDIPIEDARELLELAQPLVIQKCRHIVGAGHRVWEIDVFEGAHDGLVLAEIELGDEAEDFERPRWLGREVTGEEAYYNSTLAGV
ncbi:adenylate cyclase [Devosia pacifica]|uniref:Adenylate cyclase n=1 Tax=Devosia pacifica TaxID=1335967 RepID=A0A918VMZ8_9HYPH|nr:CYTH domain-containing protein [Devosia pacifica]GHA14132.1 adenylate cyclase [Devosia pacifica]